jgi:hypothetical protein
MEHVPLIFRFTHFGEKMYFMNFTKKTSVLKGLAPYKFHNSKNYMTCLSKERPPPFKALSRLILYICEDQMKDISMTFP